MIKKYTHLWLRFALGAFQISIVSRFGAIIFIVGKLLRFFFFLFFIMLLFSKTKVVAGYSLWQMIFFYLTFNVIDAIPQFLLRDVYRFRQQIVNGYFDYVLIKPMSPLFKSLFGGSDLLDLITLLLYIALLVIAAGHLQGLTPLSIVLYIVLVFNAFIIATAFHIGVLCLGILTTEVDNAIMLYRDVTQMGRFPVDIYKEPLRGILTFAIPIGIMMTVPAKVLMGLFSWQVVAIALGIGGLFLFLSLRFWNYALCSYSSASS